MNNQLVLNTTFAAIIKQGRPAKDPDNDNCCYRTGTLKCAVGHLIPDENYIPYFDTGGGLDASSDIILEALDPQYGTPDVKFLLELQRCHDYADEFNFIPDFTTRVSQLARQFNLEMPQP